jgi:hypothetical protein
MNIYRYLENLDVTKYNIIEIESEIKFLPMKNKNKVSKYIEI